MWKLKELKEIEEIGLVKLVRGTTVSRIVSSLSEKVR